MWSTPLLPLLSGLLWLGVVVQVVQFMGQIELFTHLLRIIIIIIIIINNDFYSLESFTSALVGLSLEFEWQQVSSSLQDSSQYSGRSQ